LLFAQIENDDDMMGRLFAVKALGGRKDKASLDKLATRLQKDEFHGVRIEAAKALAKTHTPEALGRLLSSMEQSDARVRQEVVRSIGRFYDPQAREALTLVVGSEANPDIVTQAVAALGKFSNEEVSEVLLAALKKDSYRQMVAASAVKALRAQADPEMLGALIDRVEQNEGQFKTRDFGAALDTMAYLARDLEGEPRDMVREFISVHVNSPKDQLRPMAIKALGTLKDPQAIALLETFTTIGDDSNPEKKAADAAIRTLSGEKKQADEVKDLRGEMLELQKQLRELKSKVETLGKKESAKGGEPDAAPAKDEEKVKDKEKPDE